MKKKMIHFILMIAFVMSAVHCEISRDQIPDAFDFGVPGIFYMYTAEERQEILRNLVGRYRNSSNNQETSFNIRSIPEGTQIGVVDYLVSGSEIVSHIYTVSFRQHPPILSFTRFGVRYCFNIELDSNDRTRVIGLRNQEESGSPSYFQRLPFFLSAEEQQQIRQNLAGNYRNSFSDSETIMLEIEAMPADRNQMDTLYYTINDGERFSQSYTIVFSGDSSPILSFSISGIPFRFDIEFDSNDRIRPIRFINQQESRLISYFERSNFEIDHEYSHDEL